MLPSHSCRSRSKRSSSSALSRPHLFSPCCSFQRRSRDVLWLSASRRRCSSHSWFKAHSGSLIGPPSPPCASPRTLPCASISNWLKSRQWEWFNQSLLNRHYGVQYRIYMCEKVPLKVLIQLEYVFRSTLVQTHFICRDWLVTWFKDIKLQHYINIW